MKMNSNEKEIVVTLTALFCVIAYVLIVVMNVDYREVVVGFGLIFVIPSVFLIDYVIDRIKSA
jgi:hypothetical protein